MKQGEKHNLKIMTWEEESQISIVLQILVLHLNIFVLSKNCHSTFVIIIWICLETHQELYDIGELKEKNFMMKINVFLE